MTSYLAYRLLYPFWYFWISFRVHIDAFRLNPRAYITATKWKLLGKRVRARGQFAFLLSQSPRAYELWVLEQPQASHKAETIADHGIIALVSPEGEGVRLDATLASLKTAGIRALIIDASAKDRIKAAEAMELRKAQWFMTMAAGDLIAAHTAATYRKWLSHFDEDYSVIYADDDKLDLWGRCRQPHFKPDWNSELNRHHDVLTEACILQADVAALLEALDHPDWKAKLIADATSRGRVGHVPRVLHHRASRPEPPCKPKPLPIAAALPSVAVIIPTRNRVNLLRTCISGLRATRYPDLEIIIVNNDSDDPETLAYLEMLAGEGVRVLDQPGPFNYSTINNNAVAEAKGELICLLNNDVEVLAPDWLAIMVTQALRPEVGAVGAQLLYPDGRIQHAGVVIGVGNAAGHAHRFLRPEAEGYFRRHALPQFVSAVTGACLVVRKDKFLAVDGLDEENFAVAFNDVDLCLKLNQRGWQSFYEPRAVLVHHESVSRGFDTDPVGAARFAGELAALQRIWRTDEVVDPYHHPMLSRASEQFALDLTSTMVRS